MEIESVIKIISHDMRGPLGNFKSVATLFKSGELEMEQAQMFMNEIEKGVDKSILMLDELIAWGGASTDSKKNPCQEVDLIEVVNEVHEILLSLFEEKNINYHFDGNGKLTGSTNKTALKVIVRNLMNNAVRFTDQGGEVEVRIDEDTDHYTISILDTGIGVPEEMKSTVFEMSKDNRRIGTAGEKGAGIGLFICKDLALKNDCIIWYEPRSDKEGSMFNLKIKKFK